MNAAQHILETFRTHGIDTVFGYPGGCIMPLYDALVESDVRHVLCRHEQACALAAGGYARASGQTGVCIATSGPGATNLVTGVADAHRDSIPLIVITGQVASGMIGTDAFQETDVLGMALGVVKHSYLVTNPDDIPDVMAEAFELAQSGRPGPVWIDVPKDVLLNPVTTPTASGDAPSGDAEQTPTDVSGILSRLRQAERPLLYSGGGIRLAGAETAFRRFASASGLPGVVTLHGTGNPGRGCPDNLGMLGMHGSRAANEAVEACDLLLVAGARLDDRATGHLDGFAPNAGVIHLDTDRSEHHKLRTADLASDAPLAPTLDALADALEARPLNIEHWRQHCRDRAKTAGFRAATNHEPLAPITGPAFVRQLSETLPPEATVACDVGQHQMWVAQYYDFDHPRRHLTSGGLGTMGFGLPAAMGAQFARPDQPVVNVTGDGSFMMNAQELATIRRYRLPVKIIVMDNQCLGMVRQQQELFYESRESQIDLDDNPDFAALARAFDIPALHIRRADQMRRGIEALLAFDGPMLLHVAIDRQENVWPIVRPGAANRDMMDAHNHHADKETLA
ncbi:acetolactate synthase 2 catalytic subunit [Tamilnaduibacter salinus]|uniref:Acetolactate synthase n=1 Tax=Tamilnaduibacter salinus TaxID=1484056 RepID=A0A2A2I2I3_9GAMM|nr:acetolactate synthase 2 catalytic subunit [Tamilnaduibacter salinus]PAV25802.1 acetolactate synthase 2 catalytic subunit [Tamilnaduibacter salinus]